MYEVVKKSCSQSHGLFLVSSWHNKREKEKEREKKGKRERINEERDENNKAKGPRGEERRIEGKAGGSRVSSEEEMVKRLR